MNAPTAEDIMRFRRTTYLGVLAARDFLLNQPQELCERMLRAGETQRRPGSLHDPIEDDPQTAALITVAYARAESEVEAAFGSGYFRGRCYPLWRSVERILREEHGLQWYSPARMNPTSVID